MKVKDTSVKLHTLQTMDAMEMAEITSPPYQEEDPQPIPSTSQDVPDEAPPNYEQHAPDRERILGRGAGVHQRVHLAALREETRTFIRQEVLRGVDMHRAHSRYHSTMVAVILIIAVLLMTIVNFAIVYLFTKNCG